MMISDQFGPNFAKFGNRTISAKIGSDGTAQFDQHFGRSRSNSGAKFRRTSPHSAALGRTRTKFGRHRSKFDQLRSNRAKLDELLDQLRSKSDQIRPKPAEIGRSRENVRPARVARCSPETCFGGARAKHSKIGRQVLGNVSPSASTGVNRAAHVTKPRAQSWLSDDASRMRGRISLLRGARRRAGLLRAYAAAVVVQAAVALLRFRVWSSVRGCVPSRHCPGQRAPRGASPRAQDGGVVLIEIRESRRAWRNGGRVRSPPMLSGPNVRCMDAPSPPQPRVGGRAVRDGHRRMSQTGLTERCIAPSAGRACPAKASRPMCVVGAAWRPGGSRKWVVG